MTPKESTATCSKGPPKSLRKQAMGEKSRDDSNLGNPYRLIAIPGTSAANLKFLHRPRQARWRMRYGCIERRRDRHRRVRLARGAATPLERLSHPPAL